MMNAGLMVDLPFLNKSGAEGIGLYRTELQFLTQEKVPKRSEQVQFYSKILDSANGKPVNFRTLDIGSDKVLPYLSRLKETNPALGWRAIRVTLDRQGIMRMQIQALLRGAQGRPIRILFPFIAEFIEFKYAREIVLAEVEKEKILKHIVPQDIKIGAMLETPSLAFSTNEFFKLADFISIGGNDLKQFFFAADRENERVRRRYDTLNLSYLDFLEQIVKRAKNFNTPINFCGEDAGRPLEALALIAVGLRSLSMKASSIGPIKLLIRSISLVELKSIISNARLNETNSVRKDLINWLEKIKVPYF
jgi:phosphotransferase system enzyme I (PtsP)